MSIEITTSLTPEESREIMRQVGRVFTLEGIECNCETNFAKVIFRPGNGITWIMEGEAHEAAP